MLILNSSSTEEGDVNLDVQNIKHDFFFSDFTDTGEQKALSSILAFWNVS